MNSLFALVRTGLGDATDQNLLDRFHVGRDEEAFAELVRRYGSLVWGVCRRSLVHPADAEDAFQVTFLVLARRAGQLAAAPGVGPWLHRVAVMTARNVRRGNRRRAPIGRRLDHDVSVPDPAPGRTDDRLDLDAALTRLPEKYRTAVVLCHLQGLSRREAAARLGCPEGTLSATLAAALRKLRAQLRGQDPAARLAAVGIVAVPAGLSAATARVASVDSISRLAAAGVSPAVCRLTHEVLHMFRLRRAALVAGAILAVGCLAAVGLVAVPGDRVVAAADPPKAATAPREADPRARDDEEKDLVPAHVTGTVRDGDGKPIAGARVAIAGTIGYYATDGRTPFTGRATTTTAGNYDIGFKTKPGTTTVITAIRAEADGYVAHREDFHFDELKTSPTTPGKWDFVLARGEVIAGRVAEADPGDRIPVLIRGPSFSRTEYTKPDGTFRVWVPKGVYTVTAAVHVKSVTRDEKLPDEYRTGLIIKRAAVADRVASGTEGLVLKTR